MELASKFCYVADHSDDEEFFDDETLNNDEDRRRKEKKKKSSGSAEEVLALSDDEDNYGYEKLPPERIRKVRKADPNILALNLGSLEEDAVVLFTGDAVFCSECNASLTQLSHLEPNEKGGQIWSCEYCGHPNHVDLSLEEIPKGESIDYLLSPPLETQSDQNDIIVFCIDISGSMCCTTEIIGDFKIMKNEKLSQTLDQFLERNGGAVAQQYLPRERTDVTYVSRLQCVQAAVSSQIESLAKLHPNKRVAIVTFSNDVTIYLPEGVRHVITGDKLSQFGYLVDVSNQLQLLINKSILESAQELNTVILGLEENGATALGPALLTSISIAGGAKGSSVILCTDGVANVGLGSLEGENGDDVNSTAALFYRQASEVALQKGVAVSVLSIQGTNASLEHIAKIAAETRGYNDIVDPLKLSKNFNFVLQNKVIATDVSATMFLNRGLTFRHEKQSQNSKAVREVGNCTKESVITFEYYPAKDIVKDLKQVLFQVQIRYTKLNGTKCLRVMYKSAEITLDRQEAEKHVNVSVVGLHSQAQAALLAAEGNYTKARMVQKTNMRMVRRTVANEGVTEPQLKHYNLWNQEALRLNTAIKSTKIKEKKSGKHYDSAEEDFSDIEEEEEVKEKCEKKEKRYKERSRYRTFNDDISNVIYQAQNPMYSNYTDFSEKKDD